MNNKNIDGMLYVSMNEMSDTDVRTKIKNYILQEGEVKKTAIKEELDKYRTEIKKDYVNTDSYLAVITVLGIVAGSISGLIIGLALGFVVALVVILAGAGINSAIKDRKYGQEIKKVETEAEARIKEVDEDVKKRIETEIKLYDENVRNTCQKVLLDPANIDTMIDYSAQMFKRMISHADSDSNKKFIECNFQYIVTTTDIKYWYDSEYTNPRDDFNFARQRYRDLHYEYECEGLAIALAQAVSNKIKTLYPPNTLKITMSNEDAKVVMNFKAPNENFVVARDIV